MEQVAVHVDEIPLAADDSASQANDGDEALQTETDSRQMEVCLPPEMMASILKNLDVKDLLNSCSLVCKRWNMISKQVVLDRVQYIERVIPVDTRQDLKARICSVSSSEEPAAELIATGPAESESTDVSNLFVQELESTDVSNLVVQELESTDVSNLFVQELESTDVSNLFVQELASVKLLFLFEQTHFTPRDEIDIDFQSVSCLLPSSKTTMQEKHLLETIEPLISYSSNDLIFMTCRDLIICSSGPIVQFFGRARYSTISQPQNEKLERACDLKWKRYSISGKKVKEIENQLSCRGRGAVSVYENNILTKGQSNRTVVWMKVVGVIHQLEKVTIELVREIFTAFYVDKFLFFNDKIYILYENTRFLGLWKKTDDNLILSEAPLPGTSNSSSIYRVNNLIFILPRTLIRNSTWTVVDGNEDNLIMHSVVMSPLVTTLFPNRRDEVYNVVQKIYSFNNMFIAVCAPQSEDTGDAPRLVLTAVMKKDPSIEDFASPETFRSLFYLESSKTNKLMGDFRSEPFYFLSHLNMIGDESNDNGRFIMKVTRIRRN